ncbi:MAG TPA: glycine cleavage T C-terminal barrel domain-containing protein, partial [Anaerolineales bacterium]
EVDLLDAMAEGFDDIETLKRYSTVSMGPCQGKMCSLNTIRVCAEGNGRSIAETGRTTSRPPFVPVKLGLLAGRKLEPVRLTPMHHRHLALDAKMMNAGQWLRPEHYGDPHAEVMGVHQRVGVIDVSTLGKIELRGPHSLTFLERIYTAKFADLPVGHLRYGLMCNEEGVIFDDGVVGRLADDHYYVTTTTGGLSPVYEWLAWWLAAWDYQLDLFNVTTDYAAVNLAGPRARETLQKLVAIELSNLAFPYMHLQQAQVAGIPARLMRIGFVGELGYEIHIPAQYGDFLWEALMAAGSEFGIMAFGVEAQRVLRLEKGHLIVGQDTDALTDPFGAGLGWSVKLDKGDFIGKAMLAFRRQRGLRDQLVKFEMLDPAVVPGEGEQIVESGRFIGRVTSARYSPTLEKSIGMAWVPVSKATPGAKLSVRVNGSSQEVLVVARPFYDPEGSRLRM